MGIRRHEAYERFIEYFTEEHEPPYTRQRAEELAQDIARHAFIGVESAEWLQRKVDSIDELIESERVYDDLFAPDFTDRGAGRPNVIPQDFFEQRLEGTEQ